MAHHGTQMAALSIQARTVACVDCVLVELYTYPDCVMAGCVYDDCLCRCVLLHMLTVCVVCMLNGLCVRLAYMYCVWLIVLWLTDCLIDC